MTGLAQQSTIDESVDGAEFKGDYTPGPRPDAPIMVWAHGWGQDRRAFGLLADSFPANAHLLLDFPGFGRAAPPPFDWGTEDYAKASVGLLTRLCPPGARIFWIGHSFGGRVGIRLAARAPRALTGLCLVAAAGLKRRRTPAEQIRFRTRQWSFKVLRALASSPEQLERLRQRYGSSDYAQAGAMRGVLSKTVSEDLAPVAATIATPTLLVYGERDTETPPEFGRRYAALIPGARLSLLPGQDHYSVLQEGRYVVAKKIHDFMSDVMVRT